MTDTKHTPAPWHTGGNGNRIVYGEDGLAICSCITYCSNEPSADKANADLIATAPELLEVIEHLVTDINWQKDSPSLEWVMKIINKAKGEP